MNDELTYGPVYILKIGGSQQRNKESILRQVKKMIELYNNDCKILAVLSAHYGVTDELRKESSDPWNLIQGEFQAIDYCNDLLESKGIHCMNYKQDGEYPLIGDINDYKNVEFKPNGMLKDKRIVLISGYGLPMNDGGLKLVRGGSDDVAALLSSKINDSKLIFQKDVGGIYYPWPDGELLNYVSSSRLLNEIKSGSIKQVISEGAAQIISDNELSAHVCNIDNWLKGTFISS